MSYITSCVEVCKYISVNTVGRRNTIENKVRSALLTTTSLSCCQYFSDSTISALYHPHMSVTDLSHQCFYQKTVSPSVLLPKYL